MAGFKNIKKGSIFELPSLIDYRQNRVISLAICDSPSIRIVLFSFDKDEAVTEEQTPNTEQFTLLEGEMEVVVEGKKSLLHAGDTIVVAPEDEHSLLALTPCKMLQTSIKEPQ